MEESLPRLSQACSSQGHCRTQRNLVGVGARHSRGARPEAQGLSPVTTSQSPH